MMVLVTSSRLNYDHYNSATTGCDASQPCIFRVSEKLGTVTNFCLETEFAKTLRDGMWKL